MFMNEIIAQIFSTGYVEDAQGKSYPNSTSSVSFEAGALLYDLVRTLKPDKTLETGMAYGISTLFICQAHRDNGAGCHTLTPSRSRHSSPLAWRTLDERI
jgi:predicted O-methyltransferase YrrM